MMALAMPGAAQALGLGEIHVDSGLNEPLAANIDLVGATADDLDGIKVSIANRETFQQFGVDRSAFLSGVAFKISRDSRGRPVLAIRSKDACTEPLLNMLVDLRWDGGELIRQYTLLLDPPGFPPAAHSAEARVAAAGSVASPANVRAAVTDAPNETARAAVVATPVNETARPAAAEPVARELVAHEPVAREQGSPKTMKVGARATLRGVAWRVGSRSDADLNRMMIAIFRANPSAFEGNINRLRRGAVLKIPSAAEVSVISVADANHEVSAQMKAWHASPLAASAARSVAPAGAVPAGAVPAGAVPGSADSAAIATAAGAGAHLSAGGAATPAETTLDRKVEQLESRLDELRNQLDRENDALVNAQARLTLAEKAPPAGGSQPTGPQPMGSPASGSQAAGSQAIGGRGLAASIAAILALGSAAFGLSAWRRRRAPQAAFQTAEPKSASLAPLPVGAREGAHEAATSSAPVREQPRAVRLETPAAPPATAFPDDVDIEALEASYILHTGGAGIDENVNLVETDDTTSLPSTVKIRVDDPNAQTMPVETVRNAGTSESTTRNLRIREEPVPATKAGVEVTKLDYNLVDLDATMEHVQMPSALHETAGFKERRTSLVDALKSAMARQPNRRDLQMKLLETYYAAAATNRQGFLEIVQKISLERASLNEGEWDKIAWMGRQIAADEELFAPGAAQQDDEDLADCA
jgi:pilus assembly protein FimV